MTTGRVDPRVGSSQVGSVFFVNYGESGRAENARNLFFLFAEKFTCLYMVTSNLFLVADTLSGHYSTLAVSNSQRFILLFIMHISRACHVYNTLHF